MNNFKKVALYAAVSLAAGLSAPAVLSQQAADVNVSSSAAAAAVSHGATELVDADVKDVNESVDNKVKRAHKVSKNPHFELEKKVKDYSGKIIFALAEQQMPAVRSSFIRLLMLTGTKPLLIFSARLNWPMKKHI